MTLEVPTGQEGGQGEALLTLLGGEVLIRGDEAPKEYAVFSFSFENTGNVPFGCPDKLYGTAVETESGHGQGQRSSGGVPSAVLLGLGRAGFDNPCLGIYPGESAKGSYEFAVASTAYYPVEATPLTKPVFGKTYLSVAFWGHPLIFAADLVQP